MTEAYAAGFQLRILTPMGTALSTEAAYLRAPAREGQLGIMENHAPMVAELLIGALVVTEPSGEVRYIATIEGVLRVKDDEVVVLVGAAEEADEIDVERAQRALDRARARMRTTPEEEVNLERAQLALARAANRLRVVEQAGI